MTPGDRFGASGPSRADKASWSEGMTATGPKKCPNAGGDAVQVKHRQKGIEAFRATHPFRQDVRGEAELHFDGQVGRPVAHESTTDLDRPDPGLVHPFRPGTVPNNALAAIGEQVFGKPGDKAVSLPPSTPPSACGERHRATRMSFSLMSLSFWQTSCAVAFAFAFDRESLRSWE